ncbi:hypertrehalosaemic prohormone [Anthonomus grandis grandis]|uniref:hypertrehalosaemic prohormone n=1 Tax=Anthonomus grandis grandis TaxID=2921223 RepID=UPI0021652286|nr:hypertrehalosaemic prohormone [Anthonomus grandis grandis]
MFPKLLVVFASLVLLGAFCAAQVNFSPNWGKRSLNNPAEDNDNGCKESVDSLILIYKIIQSEAQKLLECEKFSN